MVQLEQPRHEQLRIVVVSSSLHGEADDGVTERERAIREGLAEAGYNIVAVFPPDLQMPERIAQLQPDVIIIDAESDARDTLEHVCVATRDAPRPIVLFTEDNDTRNVKSAIQAGVSAYVVAGLKADRVKPILEVAVARFEIEQGLRAELTSARSQLADRKTIERAKGILMKRHGCSEEDAYKKLRGLAMEKGLKLAEIAQRVIDVAHLLD